MKLPFRHKNMILLAFIAILGTILACNVDRRENAKSILEKYYRIDSKMILDSLARGEREVFTEASSSIKQEPSQSEPVNWNQVDYFQIADALHQLVWNESLENMKLYRMHFSLGCNEIDGGMQYAQFIFFKVVNDSRIRHGIEIDPRKNFVAAWETEYYPILNDWESIDLSKIKISADQALQISEKNGGQEKRLAVDNACDIAVAISRDTTLYDGWIVTYSPSIFLDEIDPSTGE